MDSKGSNKLETDRPVIADAIEVCDDDTSAAAAATTSLEPNCGESAAGMEDREIYGPLELGGPGGPGDSWGSRCRPRVSSLPPLKAKILPPTILLEDCHYLKVGGITVRKSGKAKVSAPTRPQTGAILKVNVKSEDGSHWNKRLTDFQDQIGQSKFAKLHNISKCKVEQAASRISAKLSLCKSIQVLTISGSSKPYVRAAVGHAQEVASDGHTGSPAMRAQDGPRSSAALE